MNATIGRHASTARVRQQRVDHHADLELRQRVQRGEHLVDRGGASPGSLIARIFANSALRAGE